MKLFFIILLFFTITACQRSAPPVIQAGTECATDTIPPPAATVILPIDGAGKWTDIFLYSPDGTRNLDWHARTFRDSIAVPESLISKEGEIIVGIGNASADFSLKALSRFDSMEALCFRLEDEDVSQPLLSGVTTAGNRLRLTPLLCRVWIRSVTNCRSDEHTLCFPRVRLRDINHSAEVLRTDGFRPFETIDGPWVDLPCDVGIVTSYPGTVLYCYPSDEKKDTPGTPWPILELEYKVYSPDETLCLSSFAVGRLPRGCEVIMDLEVR